MHDTATFLQAMYAFIDDYCHRPAPLGARHVLAAVDPPHRPGPRPRLSVSHTLTLCLLSQWQRFASERDFYRYAQTHWRFFFPPYPTAASICASANAFTRCWWRASANWPDARAPLAHPTRRWT